MHSGSPPLYSAIVAQLFSLGCQYLLYLPTFYVNTQRVDLHKYNNTSCTGSTIAFSSIHVLHHLKTKSERQPIATMVLYKYPNTR